MNLHDAPLGVITNAPTYDWHMTNLRNYINLSAVHFPARRSRTWTSNRLGAGAA